VIFDPIVAVVRFPIGPKTLMIIATHQGAIVLSWGKLTPASTKMLHLSTRSGRFVALHPFIAKRIGRSSIMVMDQAFQRSGPRAVGAAMSGSGVICSVVLRGESNVAVAAFNVMPLNAWGTVMVAASSVADADSSVAERVPVVRRRCNLQCSAALRTL
jgi:hypothetical protein